jgi:two-component system, cell cycle response regulator
VSKSRPPGKILKTVPATEAPDLASAVAQAVRAPHRPVLVVISGKELGLRKVVEQSLLIGRDPRSDLVLTDELVSSRHARLEDRGDSWTLIDLGSTNGTKVNNRKGTEFALAPNDKIRFGRTVVRFEMQDALEQAYDELVERLLNIDDLSGLYVRRKFDADLRNALSTARDKQQPLGLLVMDLDGVKQINDLYGHLFGAYVIGESGHVIGRVIAGRGFGSRFGGDEYLAALPGSDLAATESVGEQIRKAISDHPFVREGIPLRPGISVGVAAYPESASDAEALFQRADEALYRAKRGGKNRVCR